MNEYFLIATESYKNFAQYLLKEIFFQSPPWYINYFWALVVFSLFVYSLELLFPWRKNQKKIREDFWLDAFYMFFNFFIFKLIFWGPFSGVVKALFTNFSGGGTGKYALIHSENLYYPFQLLLFFIVLDFVQWLTHVSLHRFSFLWNFHKVHHSVKEMGFAAHLRFHWFEHVAYTPVKFTAIMLIGGFEPKNVFILYYISIMIGHINHCNVNITYGPLKYLFNNPVMHIWHHSKKLPPGYSYGANFGISLSIWDYIFKTAYVAEDGRDTEIGFKNLERFPKHFFGQSLYPFNRKD